MIWIRLDPHAHMEQLGFIPEFLADDDPRPAKEQINDRYGFGGGWNPMTGFKLRGALLTYPGDPPMKPLFATELRNEFIVVYEHSFVLIRQGTSGPWEVARMD